MVVILSWIIAALGTTCFVLLATSSYHKHRATLAEEALEVSTENHKKAARRAADLHIQTEQQQREIRELKGKLDTANADAE